MPLYVTVSQIKLNKGRPKWFVDFFLWSSCRDTFTVTVRLTSSVLFCGFCLFVFTWVTLHRTRGASKKRSKKSLFLLLMLKKGQAGCKCEQERFPSDCDATVDIVIIHLRWSFFFPTTLEKHFCH